MDLSIILVNWNCVAFTDQCIASIEATAQGLQYEVIVVDNNSADAPCQSLLDKYPWIQLVLSDENIGFGRANNLGMQYATAPNILFLNPDTIVKPDALQRMLTALHSQPYIGALGCTLLNPDLSLQTTCVHAFPTVLNQLLALNWLQRRWPNLPLWRKQALYSTDSRTLHQVDAVSGAAILVTRKALEEVGGFNPEYFMYAEEIELCYQIQHAGWKIVHLRNAEIIHFGGQSSKKCEDSFAAVTMRDSIFRFLRRTRGAGIAALYRAGIFVSSVVHIGLLALASPFRTASQTPGAEENAVTGHASTLKKWIAILRWTIGYDGPTPRAVSTTLEAPSTAEN